MVLELELLYIVVLKIEYNKFALPGGKPKAIND
jgi:hypothetical protein